ncbi:replication initiation factor domain-containing protein [Enterococcus hirae]
MSPEHLKSVRLSRNLSQKIVANTLGIDRTFLSKIENGQRSCSEELEQQLLDFYSKFSVGNGWLEVKFDYIRIRIPTNDPKKVIEDILGMEFTSFYYADTKLFGYVEMYQKGMIRVLNSKKGDERGCLIELSGQGCRHYESVLDERSDSWKEFFFRCQEFEGTPRRLDIAVDDLEEIFSLHELVRKLSRNEFISGFQTWRSQEEKSMLEDASGGLSIYLGSPQSLMHFCFYQKNYEIAKKQGIPLEEVEIKNRYEIRMKNKKAERFLDQYLRTNDFSSLVVGVLANQLMVLEKSRENGKDNRIWASWAKLIQGVEKVPLTLKPEKPNYNRKLAYLKTQAARSIKIVKIVDETLGLNRLDEILGVTELREQDEKIIEDEVRSVCEYIQENPQAIDYLL